MVVRIISFIVTALALTVTRASIAQSHSVQEKIFENCEAARQEVSTLPEAERAALLDFLVRVIGLNTQAPAAPEAFAVLPGAKPGDALSGGPSKSLDVGAPALWQTTDAKRELRGKRCALDILNATGALAFPVATRLALLYSEQPLSDEIAVGVEETTAEIAEQAHRDGRALTEAEIELLLPPLISERPLVAQNLLQEYIVLALPRVLTYLSRAPKSDAEKILPFLRDVDPDGARLARALFDLIPRLPAENANRLAGYLPFPSKESLPPLVGDLARLAADDTMGPDIVGLLGRACELLGGVSLDSAASASLGRNPSIIAKDRFPFDRQRCLVSSVPSLAALVLPWLINGSESEKEQALALIPSALPLVDAERRGVLFGKVKDIALDQRSPLNLKAIATLPSFADRRGEVATLLTSGLKKVPSSQGDRSKDGYPEAVWGALSSLSASKDLQKVAPTLLVAFERDGTPDSAIDVVARIDSLEPGLVKLSTNRSSVIASRAIRALRAKKALTKPSLTALVEALRSPGTARAAEAALLVHGSTTVALVRKALLKTSSSQRIGPLALLEAFKAATKGERAEFAAALLAGDSCSVFEGRSKSVSSLLLDLERPLAEQVAKKVASCLCSIPLEDEKLLLEVAPGKILSSVEEVKRTNITAPACARIHPSLRAALNHPNVLLSVKAALATELLAKESVTERESLLNSLATPSPLATEVIPVIRELASTERIESDLSLRATLTLARLGDKEFDWRKFIRSVISLPESDPRHPLAISVIKVIPPEIVLAEVSPALDSDSPSRVAGACRVGAALGQLAIPIVSKVWSLREKRSPEVRYAAVLALLEINPLTPDLQGALHAILVNRYYRSAMTLPISWRQCVAVVDLNKASFGTLRTVHLDYLLSHR